jgi:hypothetical protein
LNEGLTPKDVSAHSNKRVFWRCSRNANHVWQAQIYNRTGNKSGCPHCRRARL